MFYVICKESKKTGNAYKALIFREGTREILISFDKLVLYRLGMCTGTDIDAMVPGEECKL